jgi:predicted ferric reductase
MNGITSTTALWYASRATGVVSLVLLSAVMVIGILVNRQGRLPGLPRFAVLGLHRNLSLLAVAFVALHVITAVADSFVSISLAAAVIPFVSAYEPLWLGLGAVSLDLMAAIVVTSLLRRYIGRRTWRAVHWLAYASWPVAVAHSIGSSKDLQSGPMLGLTVACILAVIGALAWRLARARAALPRARRVPDLMGQREVPGHRGLGHEVRGVPGGALSQGTQGPRGQAPSDHLVRGGHR